MKLFKVTYVEGKNIQQEVVPVNSKRFMELIENGVQEVRPASAKEAEGKVTKVDEVYYKAGDGSELQAIGYVAGNQKIKGKNLKSSDVKGVPIFLSDKEDADELVAVDLENNILTIYEATDRFRIVK